MARSALLLALTCLAWLAAPAAAKDQPDPWPLAAEVRLFAQRPLTVATLQAIERDWGTRAAAITQAGGPALRKTDEGYGAKFRARYRVAGGHVDVTSGVFDGWLREWHVRPMSLAQAKALAMAFDRAKRGGLAIDWTHPERGERSLSFSSKGDGCVASYTFMLDGQGRVVEIDDAGAC